MSSYFCFLTQCSNSLLLHFSYCLNVLSLFSTKYYWNKQIGKCTRCNAFPWFNLQVYWCLRKTRTLSSYKTFDMTSHHRVEHSLGRSIGALCNLKNGINTETSAELQNKGGYWLSNEGTVRLRARKSLEDVQWRWKLAFVRSQKGLEFSGGSRGFLSSSESLEELFSDD